MAIRPRNNLAQGVDDPQTSLLIFRTVANVGPTAVVKRQKPCEGESGARVEHFGRWASNLHESHFLGRPAVWVGHERVDDAGWIASQIARGAASRMEEILSRKKS